MTMITTTVPPLRESDDAGDVDADEAAVGSAVLADEAVAPVAASVEAAVVEPGRHCRRSVRFGCRAEGWAEYGTPEELPQHPPQHAVLAEADVTRVTELGVQGRESLQGR